MLSGFLRFLSASPDPSAVAEAIVHGPLTSLDARATTIFAAQCSDLILKGDDGFTPEFVERFHTFSISCPFDMCQAYRDGETIERASQGADAWIGDYDHDLITTSLTSADGDVPIDRSAHLHLDALSSAIVMWLALRDNDRHSASTVRRERLSPHTRITDRQLEVLQLLGEGRTNLQISVRLDFGCFEPALPRSTGVTLVTTDCVTANGTKVITADLMGSNGIIYVTDAVILPPVVDLAAP